MPHRATRVASMKLPSVPEFTRADHGLEKGPHLTMAGSWVCNTGESVTGVALTNTTLSTGELWLLKDMLQ